MRTVALINQKTRQMQNSVESKNGKLLNNLKIFSKSSLNFFPILSSFISNRIVVIDK